MLTTDLALLRSMTRDLARGIRGLIDDHRARHRTENDTATTTPDDTGVADDPKEQS